MTQNAIIATILNRQFKGSHTALDCFYVIVDFISAALGTLSAEQQGRAG